MVFETTRDAGHADIVRELIDGTVGLRDGDANTPLVDPVWRESHRDRVERVAQEVDRGAEGSLLS
ncbi:hypothetical protein [Microbispora rosea]|uniref:hypothetical protein n=1 Tax=Microbispora rosea TaxID=58117 RepID=UPI0034315AA9